jgi:hypothetical protein
LVTDPNSSAVPFRRLVSWIGTEFSKSDARKCLQDMEAASSQWTQRYGERHRLVRVTSFPGSVQPPDKVRVYTRGSHYVLQWWDPTARGNLSDRVDGDLVDALARARQIDERLAHFRSSGSGRRRLGSLNLVEAFLESLEQRANAGNIDTATVTRYRAALRHFTDFVSQPASHSRYRYASRLDMTFADEFSGWLRARRVSPNGHPAAAPQRLRSVAYVEDVARSMLRWAADPRRGGLLPTGFSNPFSARERRTDEVRHDLFGAPDITLPMAADFLAACDRYQLPLFALHLFFGVRASEPCWLFHEHLNDGWLDVHCLPELGYFTKGRRNKSLPLPDSLAPLFDATGTDVTGLILTRRSVTEGRERPPLLDASLDELVHEFEGRCGQQRQLAAAGKRHCRDGVLRDAGAVNYSCIAAEFHRVAQQLDWPSEATIKDFRHLFNTQMQNAGMPEPYRKYLLGQSPGRSAIVNYTHLDEVRQQFEAAATAKLQPLVDAVRRRCRELGIRSNTGERAIA